MHPKELAEMKIRELEEQREKRIAAGIEEGDGPSRTDAETNYVLTTENGQEYAIITIKQ